LVGLNFSPTTTTTLLHDLLHASERKVQYQGREKRMILARMAVPKLVKNGIYSPFARRGLTSLTLEGQ
jgi:hypothetical protein